MEMKDSYKISGEKLHGKNPPCRPNSILEAILKWIGEKEGVKIRSDMALVNSVISLGVTEMKRIINQLKILCQEVINL